MREHESGRDWSFGGRSWRTGCGTAGTDSAQALEVMPYACEHFALFTVEWLRTRSDNVKDVNR